MRTALPDSRPSGDRQPGAYPRRNANGGRVGAVCLLALLALACFARAARADVGEQIIERCTHGQSLSGFSQKDYRRALQELPTEVEEYSPCANLIRQAQLAAARGQGGPGAGGGGAPVAIPLSPAERSALQRVSKTPVAALRLGRDLVRPGIIHADIASAFSSLPAPLLAVLAFLLACALALGGRAIGRSIVAHRSD